MVFLIHSSIVGLFHLLALCSFGFDFGFGLGLVLVLVLVFQDGERVSSVLELTL